MVHGKQAAAFAWCGVLVAQEALIHTIPHLVADQKRLILFLFAVSAKSRTSILATITVSHPVTVQGEFFCFRNKVTPAVFAPGNPLCVLLEVERQFQKMRRVVKALLLGAFRHFLPRFLWVQITALSTMSTR